MHHNASLFRFLDVACSHTLKIRVFSMVSPEAMHQNAPLSIFRRTSRHLAGSHAAAHPREGWRLKPPRRLSRTDRVEYRHS